MLINEGDVCITRSGKYVGPLSHYDHGLYIWTDADTGMTWTEDGAYLASASNQELDLVAKFKIKEDGYYKARNGDSYGPISLNKYFNWTDGVRQWTENGVSRTGDASDDLIAEISESNGAPATVIEKPVPHVHAHLIKAWADGAEIEVFENLLEEWSPTTSPLWHSNKAYRVKALTIANTVTWYPVFGLHIGCAEDTRHIAADHHLVSTLLRIEINHTDLSNPVLIAATLEKV